MPISETFPSRILDKLNLLYGPEAPTVLRRIDALADRYEPLRQRHRRPLWDERSAVLITYGDQVRQEGLAALEKLDSLVVMDELIDLVGDARGPVPGEARRVLISLTGEDHGEDPDSFICKRASAFPRASSTG